MKIKNYFDKKEIKYFDIGRIFKSTKDPDEFLIEIEWNGKILSFIVNNDGVFKES